MTDEQRQLVYGLAGDKSLVFMPEHAARELAELRTLLPVARTWGEFRAGISDARWRRIVEPLEGDGEPVPEPAAPFDAAQIWGYEDGDWPEWPAQQMLEWMPVELQQRFGDIEDSVLNGPCLQLEPTREREIVQALHAASFTCRRDDAMIRKASGYD